MSYQHTGSKYVPGRTIKEIAKLVREDLKASIKAGKLPNGLKTSVTISRYAGGCSLTLVVTEAEPSCFNPAYRSEIDYTRAHTERPSRFTAEGKAILTELEQIVTSYQHKDVDSMSDYYSTNFHEEVRFGSDLEQRSLLALSGCL